MSASLIVIEEESGTYSGRAHPHNGYYAGDFWTDWDGVNDRDRSPALTSSGPRTRPVL